MEARWSLWFRSVLGVDEKGRKMRVAVSVVRTWNSQLHVWDPADFGGLQTASMRAHEVWTPPVALLNSAYRPWEFRLDKDDISFSHTGWAYDVRDGVLEVACRFTFDDFPFDSQHCTFEFESMVYHGALMDLNFANVTLDSWGPVWLWDGIAVEELASEWRVCQITTSRLSECFDYDGGHQRCFPVRTPLVHAPSLTLARPHALAPPTAVQPSLESC